MASYNVACCYSKLNQVPLLLALSRVTLNNIMKTNAFDFPIMLIEYMKFHDILETLPGKSWALST